MRKWTTVLALAVAAVAAAGCSSPVAPSDPMANWAAAHAHEVCLGFGRIGGEVRTKLVPLTDEWTKLVDAGWQVLPISYCNPAE